MCSSRFEASLVPPERWAETLAFSVLIVLHSSDLIVRFCCLELWSSCMVAAVKLESVSWCNVNECEAQGDDSRQSMQLHGHMARQHET